VGDSPPTFPSPSPLQGNGPTPPINSQKKDDGKPEFPGYPKPAFEKTEDVNQKTIAEIAKLKNCPWSLQVDVIDGQTVILATVHKKHEFKITCQTLDLQTGKGTLKASGKVRIAGEALNGSCETLAIPLMEDRLVLEGGAAVSIQKSSASVSDTKPAAFELKGETLNLRISDISASKFIQTSMNVDREPRPMPALIPLGKGGGEGRQWTSYGKLRNIKSYDNPASRWCLETSSGKVIAYLVAREGGSLEEYVGRTISVYGTREGEDGGHPVLRVTHIALP
jgi:hypothetical protein